MIKDKATVVRVCTCGRCGVSWETRLKDAEPKRCIGCKSPYWNKPRVRGTKKERGAK
jgi:predicted Zn-ribbon and HTH transcriptional regulator